MISDLGSFQSRIIVISELIGSLVMVLHSRNEPFDG